MFKKYKVFVILSAIYSVFIFTGCNISPVEVTEVNNISVKNIQSNKINVEITATVKNPNTSIKIRNAKFSLTLKDREIGTITQLEDIVLKGKSTETYTTTAELEITDLPGGIMAASKLLGPSKKDLKLSGKAKVSRWFFCKTIKILDYRVFN